MTRVELITLATKVVADHALKTGSKKPAKTTEYIWWSGKSGIVTDPCVFPILTSAMWKEAKSVVFPEFDMFHINGE